MDLVRLAELLADRLEPALLARLNQHPLADVHCLTVREAAAVLGLSERTTRDLVSSGALPSALFGGSRRIVASDLRAFITAQRELDATDRAG